MTCCFLGALSQGDVEKKQMSWSVIVAFVLQPAFLLNQVEMAFVVYLYLYH